MRINELLGEFGVWTTIEEEQLLSKLQTPIKLSNLSEHDQFRIQTLIRKNLVTKVGHNDPTVVANDNPKI
jgi:hypothetical protein